MCLNADNRQDPPIALTAESVLDLPSYGPGATTEDHPSQTTILYPAFPYAPYSPAQVTAYPDEPGVSHGEHFTALPENEGHASGGGGPAPAGTQASGDGGQFAAGGSKGGYTGVAGPGNGPQSSAAPTSTAMGDGGSGSARGDGYVLNGVTCSILSAGDGKTILVNSDKIVTVSQGGPAATLVSQIISAAPSDASTGGLVVGSGSSVSTIQPVHASQASSGPTTTKVIIGTKTITCSQLANGAWVVPDTSTTGTLSLGGSTMGVDTVTLSAASTGLVRVDGSQGSSGASEGSGSASGLQSTGSVQQQGATGGSQSSAASAAQNTSAAARIGTVEGWVGVGAWLGIGIAGILVLY